MGGQAGGAGSGGQGLAGSGVGGTAGAAGTGVSGSGGSGVSGSGGVSGGTGGSSAGGASAGSSGSGGGSVNALVVDDFEGVAPGSAPNPSLWSVRGSGTVQVSTEQVRPGSTQAVKIESGASGATMLVNTSVFPLPAGVIHFRVWMRFTTAGWAGHVGFVASGPGAESQEVRFGGQQDAYHANLAGDGDGLSPDPFAYPDCPLCLAPVANEWACLRGMFDFPGNLAQLYVNDVLAVDAQQDSIRNDWHSGTGTLPANPTEIAFGWAIYGGVQNTVYYDDIALGYEPIPCQ